jgi:hypothetical protein
MLADKMRQHGKHAWLVNTGRQLRRLGYTFVSLLFRCCEAVQLYCLQGGLAASAVQVSA